MYHKSMTDIEKKWKERFDAPKDNYERWIDRHNHKLEAVRTLSGLIAAATGIFVFLKVFGLI